MALFAFDGTGDKWKKGTPITEHQKTKKGRFLTNVVMFFKYFQEGNDVGKYYFSGVGTSGAFVGYAFGGFFGMGASGRVRKAFKQLKNEYANGNYDIDIVGYSRGAALARIFVDKITKDYKKLKDGDGNPLTSCPDIRFLGLFDTVASFGIPFNSYEWGFKERIPKNVKNTVHAMALDERSSGFGLDRAYGRNVLEVWFRGGHGDIGGNSEKKIKLVTVHGQISRCCLC